MIENLNNNKNKTQFLVILKVLLLLTFSQKVTFQNHTSKNNFNKSSNKVRKLCNFLH